MITTKSKMDKQEALKIIRMIAEGEDPYEDIASAYSLPEHDPRTFRAICTAIASISLIEDEENKPISDQPLILDSFPRGLVEDFIKKLGKDAILGALNKTDYKKDEAAKIIGITYAELLNKIEEFDIAKEIKPRDLVLAVKEDYRDQIKQVSLDEYLEIIEKNAILKALKNTKGLKQSAAKLLGISFRTFRYRIDKLGIDESRPSSIYSTVKPDYFKHSWEGMSFDEFLNTIEKTVIKTTLEDNQYQKMITAEKLGISFRTLRYRINKLGIE
jgi:DNA-binding NtrC family response regulator